MAKLTVSEALTMIEEVLLRCRTSSRNAKSVASALVGAELAGQAGHGLRRVPSYAGQALSGKVDGQATATADRPAAATLAINAHGGFAYPALDIVYDQLPPMAQDGGIAIAGINNSHHCGVAGLIVERLASSGLVALMFANTPAAMAPWGGNRALFGTNPIAFAAPVSDGQPIVVDVSLSKVARGKIMAAKQKGEAIPEGWALDANGKPTTDAADALAGTMIPLGDAKGTALALMVELLAAGLVGAHYAKDASSFFETEGGSPSVGQLIIAIDPLKIGGTAVFDRFAEMADDISAQSGARVPGRRRQELKTKIEADGISVDAELLAEIETIGR